MVNKHISYWYIPFKLSFKLFNYYISYMLYNYDNLEYFLWFQSLSLVSFSKSLFELSWISSVQEFLIIFLHSVVCTTFASHVLDFSPFMGFRRSSYPLCHLSTWLSRINTLHGHQCSRCEIGYRSIRSPIQKH